MLRWRFLAKNRLRKLSNGNTKTAQYGKNIRGNGAGVRSRKKGNGNIITAKVLNS